MYVYVYTLKQFWEVGLRSTYRRCRFCQKKIIFPDEAHFDLGGYLNEQNCHYRAMLNEFLFTKIEEKDIGNICFQQDSATCHTAEAAFDVLRPVFEDRVISRLFFFIIICGVPSKISVTPTSQRQLTL